MLNKRTNILALLLILLLAMALRLYHLGTQSYWLDELLSLEASAGRGQTDQILPANTIVDPGRLTSLQGAPPWWQVWTTLQRDSHPPLYYILLRGWRVLFGDAESATRSLSLLFSLVSIVLICDIGRALVSSRAGLLAALLMAIAPLHVLYAQEARNYAMLVAACLAAAWMVLRLNESVGRTFLSANPGHTARLNLAEIALLSLFLLIAMLTHYLAAPVMLALLLIAIIRSPRRVLIGFALAALIYLLIWSPFLYQQLSSFSRNREAAADLSAGIVGRTLLRAIELPIRQIGNPYETRLPFIVLSPLLLLPALFQFRRLLLPWLWFICAALFLVVTDISGATNTLNFPRYTFVISPAVFLLIAAGIQRFGSSIIPFAAIVIAAINLPGSYAPWKPDWRSLGRELSRSSPNSLVVIASAPDKQWWVGGAILGLSHYWQGPPPQFYFLTKPADLKINDDIWLIEHDIAAPPGDLLPNYRVIESFNASRIGTIYHLRPQLP